MRAAITVLAVLLLAAAVPAQIPCVPGSNFALSFDGVDDRAMVPDPGGALSGWTDFTIEFWFRTTQMTEGHLFGKWYGGFTGPHRVFTFDITTTGRIGFFLNYQGPSNAAGTFNGPPLHADGQWHHAALIVDSTVGITGLLDGAIVLAAPFVNSSPLEVSTVPLLLGARYDTNGLPSDLPYAGDLDEIRFWNVARTPTDVAATMNLGLSGAEPGLQALYRCDFGAGQTFFDATAAPLHGHLGDSTAPEATDASWSAAVTPIPYCLPPTGAGQPNSALAGLELNGISHGTDAGPFPVATPSGSTLTFDWSGPSGAAFALIAGSANPANIDVPCFGKLDVGTPPSYFDVAVLMNGLTFPGNVLFVLDPTGHLAQSFQLPALPSGPLLNVQGIVFQPAAIPCSAVFTAAHYLAVP